MNSIRPVLDYMIQNEKALPINGLQFSEKDCKNYNQELELFTWPGIEQGCYCPTAHE